MNTRIPWYYIWSPRYEIFHRMIQYAFTTKQELSLNFNDRPIFYEQSFFTKNLSTKDKEHPFQGCNAKVDLVLDCIENNMDKYFLFTDADIYIHSDKVKDMCQPFIDANKDMVFMKEENDDGSAVNIGFILIKGNEKTKQFWLDVQKCVAETKGHDQGICNNLLPLWNGTWDLFDRRKVCSSKTLRGDFVIFQALCSCHGYIQDMAEKLANMAMLTNINPFLSLVEPEIIPHLIKLHNYIKSVQH